MVININVFVDKGNKNLKVDLNKDSSVADLLQSLKINPVTVIVSRNNELILEDEKLNNDDEIKILSVISGG
mgnify:CR=1 FL=1